MLAEFPNFKKLELSDREEIEKFTRKFPSYSDFNFTSMWSWNIKGEFECSILNENLVVRFNDYLTERPFLSFIGSNQLLDTVERLIDFSVNRSQLLPVLRLLPEANFIDDSLAENYHIEEDRDNFDYVYNIELLANYPGLNYMQCRKMFNRFVKRNTNVETKIINLCDPSTMKSVLQLDQIWQTNKKADFDSKNEEEALLKFLKSAENFLLTNIGVYVDGQLVGYTINEGFANGYVISHFAKFDIQYTGIYSYLMRITAQTLLEKRYHFINCEQDLGLTGLRYSKKSFRPEFFLKKYTLIPK